jgi:hypothetical protein
MEEAESAYGRAIELDPASVQAHFNLGLLRQQHGDLEGALAEYDALLEMQPTHAWAQYELGAVYESQGQRELALDRYAEAFTLDPELLFPEKNPQIIENKLVTEALLRAKRGSRTAASTAPLAYDEGPRIQSILTPPPPHPVAPAAPTERDSTETPADAPVTGSSRDHIGRGAAPHGSRADANGNPTGATSKERVLDSTDLRGSVRNQVRGDAEAGGGTPAAAAGATSRRRSGSTVTGPGGRRSTTNQPPVSESSSPRGVGFGQRSTGSLEWKLGPASDEPVPAR